MCGWVAKVLAHWGLGGLASLEKGRVLFLVNTDKAHDHIIDYVTRKLESPSAISLQYEHCVASAAKGKPTSSS